MMGTQRDTSTAWSSLCPAHPGAHGPDVLSGQMYRCRRICSVFGKSVFPGLWCSLVGASEPAETPSFWGGLPDDELVLRECVLHSKTGAKYGFLDIKRTAKNIIQRGGGTGSGADPGAARPRGEMPSASRLSRCRHCRVARTRSWQL